MNVRRTVVFACFPYLPPFFSRSSHAFAHRSNYADLPAPLLHCFPSLLNLSSCTSLSRLDTRMVYLIRAYVVDSELSATTPKHLQTNTEIQRECSSFFNFIVCFPWNSFEVKRSAGEEKQVCERKRKCGTTSCILGWSCKSFAHLIFCKL